MEPKDPNFPTDPPKPTTENTEMSDLSADYRATDPTFRVDEPAEPGAEPDLEPSLVAEPGAQADSEPEPEVETETQAAEDGLAGEGPAGDGSDEGATVGGGPAKRGWTTAQKVLAGVGLVAIIGVSGFVGSQLGSNNSGDETATDTVSDQVEDGDADSEVNSDNPEVDNTSDTVAEDSDDSSDNTDADSDDSFDSDSDTSADTEDGEGPEEVGVLGAAPKDFGWEFQAAPGVTPEGIEGPAIELEPGDDLAAIVEASPRGAVFRFAEGLYQDQQMVPRDGDSYLGFGRAILDGSGAGEGSAAFTGAAEDVFISGFEVRNYGNVSQNGAINAQIGGSDDPPQEHRSLRWILEDLNVHSNNGVGINIGPFGQVRRVRIHSNGQLGITSHGGRAIVVEDCEINNNNTGKTDPAFEGGGSKFKFTFDLVVRNCWFHDNYGYGLWTDIDNENTLFEDNVIERETWSCISHEVSFSAVIRNNVVRDCGLDGDPWLWKAGIQVANSPDVIVENNLIENSYNGLGLIQQDRGRADWVLENVVVRNNIIRDSGQSGVVTDGFDDAGDPLVPADTIVFEGNVWDAGLPDFEDDLALEPLTVQSRTTADFRWGFQQLDWSGWQGLDLDLEGEFTPR